MNNADGQTRAGFAAVLGLPNVGKSTLINTLVGSKVSIVSKKVQTTRCRVLGIAMQGAAQVVLVDTPGIFEPKKTMEKAMVKAAWEALSSADVIVHLVDASAKDAAQKNQIIISKLPKDALCVLVINKTDAVNKQDLLALSQTLNDQYPYEATFMISALKGQGTDDVLDYLTSHMPEGPHLFDPDQITDMPMRLLAAEITREKIFKRLHQELPYDILVETEGWEEFDNGSVKINQVVFVSRDSQKGIVLGKGGSQIKRIGEAARKELEELLGRRVHLKLFVKVQENWQERRENYHLMGLDYQG